MPSSGRVVAGFMLIATARIAQPQASASAVWDSIGAILRTVPVPSGGYQRYNLPRRDLTLRVGDLLVSPSLGLGAWVGFVGSSDQTTMAGDLVVLPTELKVVLAEFVRQDI